MQGIAQSMAEQSQGAREILASVRSLIEATARIKELAGDQRDGARHLVRAAYRKRIESIVEGCAVIERGRVGASS